MKKIKAGVLGIGFIGRLHVEALRRLGYIDIATASRGGEKEARAKANELSIEKSYGSYMDLINDPEIEVVHICTPNVQHYEQSKAALLAGKHVICEKPFTTTIKEAEELVKIAREKNLVNAIHFNIRYYPLIYHAKAMVRKGEIGKVLAINGSYTQDWLLYETDYNWIVESEYCGNSRVVDDLGSHWFDLMEFITGSKVSKVLADYATFFPIRKKPLKPVETFSGKVLSAEDLTDIKVTTEDYATVLVQFNGGAHGSFTTSQSFAGRKNRCYFEIYGTKKSLVWDEERPNELWVGSRDEGNMTIMKDPSLLDESALEYASYPGGHNEGFNDTSKQLFRKVYEYIKNERHKKGDIPSFPTFKDGLREAVICDGVFKSSKEVKWIDIE
jgi:predicted dehydrogenase